MENAVLTGMEELIGRLTPIPEFGALLKQFAADKAGERAVWGDLTKQVHSMLGGSSPLIGRLAALTELIVLALDIADDLQDQDNQTKSWMQCPPELALNAVLAFLAGASGELERMQTERTDEQLPSPGIISQMIMRAVNGQYKDLTGEAENEEAYIGMVQEKSGSLVRLACYMGSAGLLSSEKQVAALNEFADCAGIANQLENDIRDLQRFDLKNDLLYKKKTLPVLFLLADEDGFPAIRQYYEGNISREQFLQHKQTCIDYIRASGCIEYTEAVKQLYARQAEEALETLPAPPSAKRRLIELVIP